MLVGRRPVLLRIEAMLAQVQSGASRSILVLGDPGIGKSSLCRHVVESAPNMRRLLTRSLESETELAFADLASLLMPIQDRLADLPSPQREALAGALGIGPPVAGDPLTVSAATLSVLAAAADDGPLLVVIDDAHWLDGASAAALTFAARRLGAEGIAMVFAARPVLDARVVSAGLPEIRLTGLELTSSAALVKRESDGEASPSVIGRLHLATGGNPLALIEACSRLTREQLAGGEPLSDPLPVGYTLQEALRRRILTLPPSTQRTLLVAAASDVTAMRLIAGALEELGLKPEALEPAELAGIVAIEAGELTFRHPLLRSAVYHGAPAPHRRAAHAALARALKGPQDASRRAWHLAYAAVTPSEGVARTLEGAAEEARARGGPHAAARAFERAGRLSPDAKGRARRLFEAAVDYDRAGWPRRALRRLDEALEETDDQLLRADIQMLRGRIESWNYPTEETQRLLLEQAAQVESVDPRRAALLLINATTPSFLLGDTAGALAIAERAYAVARADPSVALLATLPLASAVILRGDSDRGRQLALDCLALIDREEVLAAGPLAGQLMLCLAWLEEYEAASAIAQRALEAARRASAPGVLRLVLASASELEFRLARWPQAYAHASEAVELAREAGSGVELTYALGCLARIEAAQGREESCRAHVEEARGVFGDPDLGPTSSYAPAALGLLELGIGRIEQAIEQLELVAARGEEHGVTHPNVVAWRPDLVEAYARAGRTEEAQAALHPLVEEAERSGSAWARGAAWRCEGLLSSDDRFEAPFKRALRHQTGSHAAFERARTELCLGERLRRSQRRVTARAALQRALVAFERLGAASWARRAHLELRATGGKARRRDESLALQLTPQELQVALTVARGATNRETAAALFLSPKTVEFHLGRVYRKLNIRSRTELARVVVAQELENSEDVPQRLSR